MSDDPQDDQNVVSIFDRYAITSNTGSLAVNASTIQETAGYRAIQVDKTARRHAEWLDITMLDGASFMLPYHLLTEVYLTSHQHLSLIYASGVVTLMGRRLEEVKALIQRGQLVAVTCFDPQRHQAPPDGEVLITTITRQSMREITPS